MCFKIYFIITFVLLLFLTIETRPLFNKLINKVGPSSEEMYYSDSFACDELHVTSCTSSKHSVFDWFCEL